MSIAQARMYGDPHTAERSITLVTHSRNARAEHVNDFETQCGEPDTEGGATLSGKAICGCVRHSAGWLIEASEKVCAPRSRKNHALTIVRARADSNFGGERGTRTLDLGIMSAILTFFRAAASCNSLF